MNVKVNKIIKSCDNCKYRFNNVPHTCDECDSLDNPDYYMWEFDPNYKNNKENPLCPTYNKN